MCMASRAYFFLFSIYLNLMMSISFSKLWMQAVKIFTGWNKLYQRIFPQTHYNYHMKALEVMPDHIHIFVDVPQMVAPCDVVRTLKSLSAIELFKVYPELKHFYARCGVLWSRGYFVSTAGHISEATVIKYIEEQKSHD